MLCPRLSFEQILSSQGSLQDWGTSQMHSEAGAPEEMPSIEPGMAQLKGQVRLHVLHILGSPG